MVSKPAISRYFQPFTSFVLSVFKSKTCILHHFAFLDWLPIRNFPSPITHFQPLKTHFLTVILPLSAMFLMALKGFIYTIAVHFYAFSSRIQRHFALHLAPKRLAFSTKTHCIQHQNALRLAPKCTAFSGILHCIQHPVAQNLAQKSAFCNKHSFCQHSLAAPFYIITNRRENRFFETRQAFGGQRWHS